MPNAIKAVAFALPLTHGIDLSRHFIMGTDTIWPIEVEFGALLTFLILLSLLAKLATSYLKRRVKKEGLALA
ncbi:MAG: hypothetical protein ACUVTL_02460 [Thermoproteota archaeon]